MPSPFEPPELRPAIPNFGRHFGWRRLAVSSVEEGCFGSGPVPGRYWRVFPAAGTLTWSQGAVPATCSREIDEKPTTVGERLKD